MKKVENTQKLLHQQKRNDEHFVPLSVTYSQTLHNLKDLKQKQKKQAHIIGKSKF